MAQNCPSFLAQYTFLVKGTIVLQNCLTACNKNSAIKSYRQSANSPGIETPHAPSVKYLFESDEQDLNLNKLIKMYAEIAQNVCM